MAEYPDAQAGRAPSPDPEQSGFLWMVETIHHELGSDGEISPARGRPTAHPAPPPLQSSRGSCSCNPAEPSKTISSIQSGIFQSFLQPERVTISAPVKLIRRPSKPAKNHGSAPSLPPRECSCLHHPAPPSTRRAAPWDRAAPDTKPAASLAVSEIPKSEWFQMLGRGFQAT